MKGVVLSLLLAAPASAQGVPLIPPAEYDYPYPGLVKIAIIGESQVARQCSTQDFRAPFMTAGCAWEENNTCYVIVAKHSPRATVRDLIRHEIAHCNGWQH